MAMTHILTFPLSFSCGRIGREEKGTPIGVGAISDMAIERWSTR